jgi:hypothetical protein
LPLTRAHKLFQHVTSHLLRRASIQWDCPDQTDREDFNAVARKEAVPAGEVASADVVHEVEEIAANVLVFCHSAVYVLIPPNAPTLLPRHPKSAGRKLPTLRSSLRMQNLCNVNALVEDRSAAYLRLERTKKQIARTN